MFSWLWKTPSKPVYQRKCIECEFYREPNHTCFLVYMNQQDASRGNGSEFCRYSESEFRRISKDTISLRGSVLPSIEAMNMAKESKKAIEKYRK